MEPYKITSVLGTYKQNAQQLLDFMKGKLSRN